MANRWERCGLDAGVGGTGTCLQADENGPFKTELDGAEERKR